MFEDTEAWEVSKLLISRKLGKKKNLFKFAFYVFLSFNLDLLWVNCLSLSKLVLNSFGTEPI